MAAEINLFINYYYHFDVKKSTTSFTLSTYLCHTYQKGYTSIEHIQVKVDVWSVKMEQNVRPKNRTVDRIPEMPYIRSPNKECTRKQKKTIVYKKKEKSKHTAA